MATHSSILESPKDRSLVGYNPWRHKELDMTEQLTLSLQNIWLMPGMLFRDFCQIQNVSLKESE